MRATSARRDLQSRHIEYLDLQSEVVFRITNASTQSGRIANPTKREI